jgi:8-oxo-dGTP pyrophosphatase MutT (NUDIX family)
MNMSAPPVAAVRQGWRPVVTAFIKRASDSRVLVVKRSDAVSTYPGMWGGISGGLEAGDASLIDRALCEIEEEAGVPRGELLHPADIGRPLAVCDGGRRFLVHPFAFVAADHDGPRVTLNWENSDYAWVTPAELAALPHVPLLPDTLARVSGRGVVGSRAWEHWGRLLEDRAHGAAELAGWVIEVRF